MHTFPFDFRLYSAPTGIALLPNFTALWHTLFMMCVLHLLGGLEFSLFVPLASVKSSLWDTSWKLRLTNKISCIKGRVERVQLLIRVKANTRHVRLNSNQSVFVNQEKHEMWIPYYFFEEVNPIASPCGMIVKIIKIIANYVVNTKLKNWFFIQISLCRLSYSNISEHSDLSWEKVAVPWVFPRNFLRKWRIRYNCSHIWTSKFINQHFLFSELILE